MLLTEKQNTILRIPKEYRKAVLPAPKSVKIELTGRCNYRCNFCPLSMRDQQPTEDMDWDFFKRITAELRKLGTEEVGVFYIGESFLNPGLLVDAITYLKQSLEFPYVFLTSNASLATQEAVGACMAAGLDSLKWSCNTYGEEQFKDIIKVSPRMLEVAKTNVRLAWELRQEMGYRTGLYASSIKYDDDQLSKMEDFIRVHVKPYVDEHYWLPLYSAGGQTGSKEHGYKPTPGNTGRVDDPQDPLPCWTVFTEGHIMVDGRLSACCLDAKGIWVMGDLKKQGFMEAWNSDNFVKLREAHLKKDVTGTVCEKCVLYS